MQRTITSNTSRRREATTAATWSASGRSEANLLVYVCFLFFFRSFHVNLFLLAPVRLHFPFPSKAKNVSTKKTIKFIVRQQSPHLVLSRRLAPLQASTGLQTKPLAPSVSLPRKPLTRCCLKDLPEHFLAVPRPLLLLIPPKQPALPRSSNLLLSSISVLVSIIRRVLILHVTF